jgi:TonB family protein
MNVSIKFFVALILVFVSNLAKSQTSTPSRIYQRFYLDFDGYDIDSSKADIMRIVQYDTINHEIDGDIIDYFKGTNLIEMQGNFIHNNLDGNFVFFYRNGNRRMQGSFAKNKKVGNWKYWYENGYSQAIINHDSDNIKKIISYWELDATQSITKGNGSTQLKLCYQKKGLDIYEISTSIEVKDSLPHGIWSINYNHGKNKCELVFEKGLIKQIKNYDFYDKLYYAPFTTSKIDIESYSKTKFRDNTFVDPRTDSVFFRTSFNKLRFTNKYNLKNKPANSILEMAEKMPSFPGGESKMAEFISSKLRYPKEARDRNVTGKVMLNFVVTTDGSIVDIEVLKDIGYGCSEEATKVLLEMPKWIPGADKGKPVDVRFTLPIQFSFY